MSTDTPLGRLNWKKMYKDLERTLATKELAETKLREFLARLFHYANNLDTDCCYTDKARPDCDLYGSGLWQEVEELLSTPITTEALDSYVAEKVKEALIDHISLANFLRFEPANDSPPLPAQPTEQPK